MAIFASIPDSDQAAASIEKKYLLPRSVFVPFSLLLLVYPSFCVGLPGLANRVAGLIALCALIWGWSGVKRLNPELKKLQWAVLFYVGVAVISLWNNSNWDFAGWRFSKYYPFLLLAPLAGILIRTGAGLRSILFWSLCGASLTSALVSGVQLWVFDFARAGWDPGLHPNIFGHLAALFAVTLFSFAYVGKFKGAGRASLFFCILALFTVWASGSRGVMLGVLPGLLLVPLLDVLVRGFSTARLKAGAAVFLGIALITLFAMSQSEIWKTQWHNLGKEIEAYSSGDYTFTSVGSRLAMAYGGYIVWQNHPWIGTGLGDVQDDIDRLIEEGRVPLLEDTFAILHNMYMDSLASTGLIGLFSMIAAIFLVPGFYFFRSLKRAENSDARVASLAGLGGILLNGIFGITNSWLYLRGLLPVLVLFTILSVLAQRQNKRG